MAESKVGALIKEARSNAKLTQTKLAEIVGLGLTPKDISAAERGQKELTAAQLKGIARATGITQKSLLQAASGIPQTAPKKETASKKTSSSSGKETSSKKETASSKKSDAAEFKLTATEKKLVELYRKADTDTKKSVMSTLKGEKSAASGIFESLVGSVGSLLTREIPQDGENADGGEEKSES